MIQKERKSFYYMVSIVFAALTFINTSYGVPLPGALLRTRFVFHISRYIKKRTDGPLFNFHHITGNISQSNGAMYTSNSVVIKYNADNSIAQIEDGKKTPLFLGSIPTKKKHIDTLKKALTVDKGTPFRVALHTLNESWECKTSGLDTLVKGNKEIIQYTYSTPDFTPPALINIIHAVYNLEHRDDQNINAAFVHCKAGRGRSATIVASYIASVMHKAGVEPSVDKIVAYLVSIRPQVSLKEKQKNVIGRFIQLLKQAKNIENLYNQVQIKA